MLLKYIYILIISAIPFIELRGAIPASQILELPLFSSIIVSIVGNILPIPFVYFFAKKILEFGKENKYFGKIFKMILDKGHKIGEKIISKSENGFFLALLLFVAIPLPGTGAYSAMLGASFLDIDFKKSFFAIFLGIIIAGFIVAIITYFFKATI
ncbi:COG2426 family protein [Streptobacillus moniliformis]|uniref:COG2426 family protein n=1 Tax=Streptobacillus moniliformis TaxID=34105 RepID=UPI0007E3B8A1|nr:small multi-drug export protein [Streptobacillus moniliformis]